MGRQPGFLVVGECVADVVRAPGEADRPYPGGSPANVAFGLARLERPVTLLTQLGADPMGKLIRRHLTAAGVRLAADGQEDRPTPTAVVTLDADGRASYDFAIGWTLRQVPADDHADADHVHLGSIGAVVAPGAAAARALAAELRARNGATVSYDPNVRPALFGERRAAVAAVEECVRLSHVVKASDEDLAWLYPGTPPQESLARWLTLGPALVLLTRGGDGASAWTSAGLTADAPAARAAVVDTVGAGDAFMSATLDALAARGLIGSGADAPHPLAAVDAETLDAVLAHAVRAAGLTVSRAGAQPPGRAELGLPS